VNPKQNSQANAKMVYKLSFQHSLVDHGLLVYLVAALFNKVQKLLKVRGP
jgi:hypothetical protein